VPQALCAIWAGLGAPPLAPHTAASLGLAALQALLAASAFLVAWRQTGHPILSAQRLPFKEHLVLRTVAASLVALVGVSAALGALALVGIAAFLEHKSGGYVSFTRSGIVAREAVLEKNGKTVRLIGMMHVGEGRFYAALFSEFPAGALVLLEGVTDRENRLARDFSYRRMARALGLEEQQALQAILTRQGDATGADRRRRADLVHADVDLSEFSEVTIRFLREVAGLYGSQSVVEALGHLHAVTSEFSDQEFAIVMADLIDRRNARVIAAFDSNAEAYDTVIIPWGALHMPGFERALEERGYRLVAVRSIPLVRYSTMLGGLAAQLRRATGFAAARFA
jgi:hypothetical protein